jgi:hypothetical protein
MKRTIRGTVAAFAAAALLAPLASANADNPSDLAGTIPSL